MIELVVFEDDTTSHGAAFLEVVRFDPPHTNLSVRGESEEVKWHESWNALGSLIAKKCTKITTDKEFQNALTWCKTFSGNAICYFDYTLKGVNVQPTQLQELSRLEVLFDGRRPKDAEMLKFFNEGRQGLVLAAALAENFGADADIWHATLEKSGAEKDAERLQKMRPRINVKATVSLAKASMEQALASLKNALAAYQDKRTLDPVLQETFWPEDAKGWFASAAMPVPHDWIPELPTVVRDYLAKMGISNAIAMKWHEQKRLWEVLKQFVGACATAHNGSNYSLPLGSLLLPLSRVLPPSKWANTEAFKWKAALGPIADVDRARSRALIHAAVKLFKQFCVKRDSGNETNEMRAQFRQEDTDGMHLLIDFGFDCSVGRETTHRSLVAKSQVSRFIHSAGDSFEEFHQFLEVAVMAKGGKGELFVALYPVEENGKVWTRLDFKASNS